MVRCDYRYSNKLEHSPQVTKRTHTRWGRGITPKLSFCQSQLPPWLFGPFSLLQARGRRPGPPGPRGWGGRRPNSGSALSEPSGSAPRRSLSSQPSRFRRRGSRPRAATSHTSALLIRACGWEMPRTSLSFSSPNDMLFFSHQKGPPIAAAFRIPG